MVYVSDNEEARHTEGRKQLQLTAVDASEEEGVCKGAP
jgi:hypothetical protein